MNSRKDQKAISIDDLDLVTGGVGEPVLPLAPLPDGGAPAPALPVADPGAPLPPLPLPPLG